MDPITLSLILAGGIGKLINSFSASEKADEGRRALDELSKQPYAKYTVNPEIEKSKSLALHDIYNPKGLTAGERAAYTQDVAGNINTLATNATNTSGGSLSKYIINALNPAVISASNKLVGMDADLKRSNQNAAYGRYANAVNTIQNIDNMNTTADLNRRGLEEQYLGQSVLQNEAYNTNALDSLSNDLISGGLMLGLGGAPGRQTSTYRKPINYNQDFSYWKNI